MKITISSTRSKSFNKQIDFYDLFHLTLFKEAILHQMELMEPDCLESVVLIDRCRGLIRSKSQLFFSILHCSNVLHFLNRSDICLPLLCLFPSFSLSFTRMLYSWESLKDEYGYRKKPNIQPVFIIT